MNFQTFPTSHFKGFSDLELSLVTGSLAQLVEHQAGNLRLWVQFPHEATFSCFWFFPPGGLQILRLSSLGYFSEQKIAEYFREFEL